jgi:PAN domain
MNYPKSMRNLIILCAVPLVIGMNATFARSSQDQFSESNTNRQGNDYKSFDLNQPLPMTLGSAVDNCRGACQKDGNCKAWTYVNPGIQGAKAKCWLKNAIPAAKVSSCCTSGVVEREFESNTDRPGSDYRNFTVTTASLCQDTCKKEDKCKAWTYVNPGIQGPQARCWLKNAVPPANTSSTTISGVVDRFVQPR